MIEKMIFAPYYFATALLGWAIESPRGWIRKAAFIALLPVIVPAAMYLAHAEEREERIKAGG